jgi:D-aminopeptidase
VIVGVLPPGPQNAIADVVGVAVGHSTLIRGEPVRTGVTAILPHGGNLFQEKVPGAILVGNGLSKLMGSTQVNGLGEIETPILLTSPLSVPRVAGALIDYMLGLPGNCSLAVWGKERGDDELRDISRKEVSQARVRWSQGIAAFGKQSSPSGTRWMLPHWRNW